MSENKNDATNPRKGAGNEMTAEMREFSNRMIEKYFGFAPDANQVKSHVENPPYRAMIIMMVGESEENPDETHVSDGVVLGSQSALRSAIERLLENPHLRDLIVQELTVMSLKQAAQN